MTLELYHRWGCPYSAKVRNYIKEHHLEDKLEMIEVDEVDNAIETLMELNHNPQVPCLLIDDQPLLESKEIIRWLDDNILGNAEQPNV